jgi:MFS family permease
LKRLPKQELWIISALALATLATRIPYRSHYLFNWDSANFALGLERFSIYDHQPQPPGYILYITVGRLFNFFLDNPNNALVFLSIVSSVAAVVGIYLLANSIFDRATGLIASVLLIFSPLAWFYGEVALSYMVELPLVLAAIWLLYQLLFHRRHAVLAAIVLGIAAGFRQDVLMFLGPFWLVGSFRVGVRTMLLSWLAMAVSIVIWMAPLIYLAEGISKYRELNSLQFRTGVFLTSIFSSGSNGGVDGFFRNAKEVWRAMLWLMGSASILFIFIAGLFLMPSKLVSDRRYLFLILLFLPAFSFFVLFHFGQPGYLLVYSAPLVLMVSRVLIMFADDLNRAFSHEVSEDYGSYASKGILKTPGGIFLVIFLALVVLINTGLFLRATRIDQLFPTADGMVSSLFGNYSAMGIRESDMQMEAVLAKVNEYDPANTIVGSVYVAPTPYPYAPDWRRLMYYLPEYRVLMLQVNSGNGYSVAHDHFFNPVEGNEINIDEDVTKTLFIGVKPVPASVELVPVQQIPGHAPITVATIPLDGSIQAGPFHFVKPGANS